MFNTLGQEVQRWGINNKTTISVHAFPPGIYIYRFVTGDGSVGTGKLVID